MSSSNLKNHQKGTFSKHSNLKTPVHQLLWPFNTNQQITGQQFMAQQITHIDYLHKLINDKKRAQINVPIHY